MQARAPIPILRFFDKAVARAFYIDFLGFAVDWEHRFEPGLPLYLQIRLGHACCICPGITAMPLPVVMCVCHAPACASFSRRCSPSDMAMRGPASKRSSGAST